jgi:hypothetical protein
VTLTAQRGAKLEPAYSQPKTCAGYAASLSTRLSTTSSAVPRKSITLCAITDEFELQEAELLLLLQAARTADYCESLQAELDRDGPTVPGLGDMGRVHPAGVELRQQRVV